VTLYNSALNDGLSPGQILSHMNEALCQNNDACMFVTALCGTLDLASGSLVMANAGHMHPVIHTAGQEGELPVDGGPALGLMEDLAFPDVEHRIPQGAQLLMYTDGISEAFNAAKEQYEEERLLSFVAQATSASAAELGELVLADVDRFVAGAEQSDDITLLVLQYGN
jgi:sigma-B regulation protein RsbU (phosphoserine phosphatase)